MHTLDERTNNSLVESCFSRIWASGIPAEVRLSLADLLNFRQYLFDVEKFIVKYIDDFVKNEQVVLAGLHLGLAEIPCLVRCRNV